jgi:hypothetical protein
MSIHEHAKPLYDKGLADTRIAKELGCSRTTVRHWRKQHDLPSNFERGACQGYSNLKIVGEVEERARTLYGKKLGDPAISEKLGCTPAQVRGWRHRNGLAPNIPWRGPRVPSGYKRGKSTSDDGERGFTLPHRANPAWRNPLWARAAKAVGSKISRDLVEESISDIVLAVLEGRMAEGDIETQARKVSNRAIETWASKFGHASLDAARGDEGWSLYDLIPDDDQVSSLRYLNLKALAEKMGIDVAAVLNDDVSEFNERGGWAPPTPARHQRTLSAYDGRLRQNRQSDATLRSRWGGEYPLAGEMTGTMAPLLPDYSKGGGAHA